MIKKRDIPYIIIAVFLILVSVIAGIVFRFRTSNCGIADISNINDIQKGTVILNYAWEDADTFDLMEGGFELLDSRYNIDSASVIAVVSPTGNLDQSEGSIGQEFIVKKVIRGSDSISIDDCCYVYQYFGFYPIDGTIEFMNTLNLMNVNSEYLIFMDESPLNPYQSVATFILHSEYFGYVKIGEQDTKTLDRDYRSYDFLELSDYEFFSTSELVTEELNRARFDILNEYYY